MSSQNWSTNGHIERLTSRGEHIMRRSEPIRFRHGNREPNDTEEEVQHHDGNRKLEGQRIVARRQIIDCDRNDEEDLR